MNKKYIDIILKRLQERWRHKMAASPTLNPFRDSTYICYSLHEFQVELIPVYTYLLTEYNYILE